MQPGTAPIVEEFLYPSGGEPPASAWSGFAEAGTSFAAAPEDTGASAAQAPDLAEQTRRSFEAGLKRGIEEGRTAERAAQAAARASLEQQRATQYAHLVESFAQARDAYLRDVEREVVELALAVAARILRREAQMDPLLLTGAVRVALGQLAQHASVRLLVPPGDLALWTEALAHLPHLNMQVKVDPGDAMRLGDCVLETDAGSVDLGLRAQLGEIERGFFDRTPAGAAVPADPQDEVSR